MSNINPFNVDVTYPISGADNDTQGFRDNFTGIQNNFINAKSEIETLQNSAVSSGVSVVNNLLGAVISDAEFRDNSLTVINKGPVSGTVTFDHSEGHVQTLTTSGNVIFEFANFPEVGELGSIIIELTVASDYTVTLPAEVTTPPDFVIAVDGNATYWYEIISRDQGATYTLFDHTRSYGTNTENINLTGNTISTTTTDTDIIISPNGTGNINLGSEIIIDDNIIRTTTSGISLKLIPSGTGDVELGTEITIDGNTIKTLLTNADLELNAAGTGTIELLTNTNITGSLAAELTTLSGNLVLNNVDNPTITLTDTTVPVTTQVLSSNSSGIIRTTSNHDLILQTNSISAVIIDTSQNITFAGTINSGAITSTGNITGPQLAIQGNRFVSLNTNADIELVPSGTGNINLGPEIIIDGNTIKTANTNADIELSPAGSGVVNIGQLSFGGNNITTNTTNANIELNPSGTGTVEFRISEQTTIGAAGGADALPGTPLGYINVNVNGVACSIPFYISA